MKRALRTSAEPFALESLESRSMMAADLVAGGLTLSSYAHDSIFELSPWLRQMVFSVVNMGNRRAPVGSRVRFFLSRDVVLDSGDRAIRDSVMPVPVRPGERVTFTKMLSIPKGMDGGMYNVLMEVDPNNTVTETDESNNMLSSASTQVYLQPRIGSLEINKKYIRPGSAATLTARNITNMDPDAGEVRFYRVVQPVAPNNVIFAQRVLIGVGTRVGHDYQITFVADGSWLTNTNYFVAEARKHDGQNYPASVAIEGRNIGPTIASFAFSPTGLVRGQSVSFTASGVAPSAGSVGIYFDSNFDGTYTTNTNHQNDLLLATASQSGTTWTASFVVPTWFPSAPTRVFIVTTATGVWASRVYSLLLSAHG